MKIKNKDGLAWSTSILYTEIHFEMLIKYLFLYLQVMLKNTTIRIWQMSETPLKS